MRSVTLFCLVCVAVNVCVARPNTSTYTDKYDNIDLEEILSNRRLLIPYVKCVLDQGKCSPEGKELKVHIKEALEEECAKCTKKQKEGTEKMIKHLIQHEKEFWKQISDKYDPEGKFTAKYQEKYQIKA